ncbi:MAG: hypothetical protein DRJ03_30405, partial [Chloroflexi bacterium]
KTGSVYYDNFLPTTPAFKKVIRYFYKYELYETQSYLTITVKVKCYDKDKNYIETKTIRTYEEEGHHILQPYQDDHTLCITTLADNTRYIRPEITIELKGGAIWLSYFYMYEPVRISKLYIDNRLDMNEHTIFNLPDPQSDDEAANKGYVDTALQDYDPTLKQYDSSTKPACDSSTVGMMILYNREDDNYYYQDVQVCMGNDNIAYQWVTLKTLQTLKGI